MCTQMNTKTRQEYVRIQRCTYVPCLHSTNIRPLATHFVVANHTYHPRYDVMVMVQSLLWCLSLTGFSRDASNGLAFRLGSFQPGTTKEVEMPSGQLDGGVAPNTEGSGTSQHQSFFPDAFAGQGKSFCADMAALIHMLQKFCKP